MVEPAGVIVGRLAQAIVARWRYDFPAQVHFGDWYERPNQLCCVAYLEFEDGSQSHEVFCVAFKTGSDEPIFVGVSQTNDHPDLLV